MFEYDPGFIFRDSFLLVNFRLKGLAIAILYNHDLQILVFEDIITF